MKGFQLPQKFYVFLSKYLNTIVLIFVIIILSILVYFLYNNFYLTLSEAKEVSTLQKKVISEQLKKDRLHLILENIKNKTNGNIVSTNTTTTTSTIPTLSASSTSSTIPLIQSTSTATSSKTTTKSTSTTTSTKK